MQNGAFPPSWPAPETPIVVDERPVSFAGNGAVVLVVLAIIVLTSTALLAIYDLLVAACSLGCPA